MTDPLLECAWAYLISDRPQISRSVAMADFAGIAIQETIFYFAMTTPEQRKGRNNKRDIAERVKARLEAKS